MKSVDRDERKKPESHSPRQYNMNVWTAVLQKKNHTNIFRSFAAHSKAQTMYFTSDLLSQQHNIFTQIQSRAVCMRVFEQQFWYQQTHPISLFSICRGRPAYFTSLPHTQSTYFASLTSPYHLSGQGQQCRGLWWW